MGGMMGRAQRALSIHRVFDDDHTCAAGLASHTMSGGMAPPLARATWLVGESLAKDEHVSSTRMARSASLMPADESNETSRLQISTRLSACFEASAQSAPATHSCKRYKGKKEGKRGIN